MIKKKRVRGLGGWEGGHGRGGICLCVVWKRKIKIE